MARILGLIPITIVLALATGGASGAAAKHAVAAVPTITHGVIVGDVTASTALLWARADREATLNAVLSGGRHGRIAQAPARAEDDFTARIQLEHLAPGTTYRYRAWFTLGSHGSPQGPPVKGSFRTAAERDTAAPLRLAFGGDRDRFDEFCRLIRQEIPDGTRVVLRGSVVTGRRWKDGAPFDSEGAGTSDLDLTLVGDEAVALFKPTGFFVPGVHSRPVSEDDPDIAPALIPLREGLMVMVGRPVNIQASRDLVIRFRGDLLDQPYLTLIE